MSSSVGSDKLIKLEGELTIFTAVTIAENLNASLANGDSLAVDLSAVSEIDSAGLQVMIAAKRMATELNLGLRFIGHSPAVLDILDLSNLVGHFGDQLVYFGDREACKGVPA